MSACTSCGGSGEVGTFDETGEIAGIAGCLDCGQTGKARSATPTPEGEATRVGRACAEAARDALAWMERWNAPVEARKPLAAAVKEAQWMGWLK